MTIFVSGASGNLGRRVVELLRERDLPVVAGSRNPDGLTDLGVETRRFDYNDPATVKAAMAGIDRALFISGDDVGNRAGPQAAAVEAAGAAGLNHVVYTSIVHADDPTMAISGDHRATEEAITRTFDGYTILRNNLYAELVIGAVAPAVASGTLYTARGDGRIAWVSREDCARAAAAALADGFDGARTLDITGPEALSGDDMAALFADLSGKSVTHASIPGPALIEGMTASGLPRPVAELLLAFDDSAKRGLLGDVSTDLETLTGQAGVSLRAVLDGLPSASSQ